MVATRSRSGRLPSPPSRGRTAAKSPGPAPRPRSARGRSTSRRTAAAPASTAAASTPAAASSKSWAATAGAGDRVGAWGVGGAAGVALSYGGAVALMVACPAFAIYFWLALTRFHGSPAAFYAWASKAGFAGVRAAWPSALDPEAWSIIAGFGALQALLQLALPGKRVKGPVTPKGNVPVYVANGVASYFVTLAAAVVATRTGHFNPARVYDKFGEILSALNAFSLLFCGWLWAKGHLAPSSTDAGSTGSLVYDFYWGMELYPRIGKHFDVKTWTNCRFGMNGWAMLALAFAYKQYTVLGRVTNSMAICAVLINVYLVKFFVWEPGYWASMDIAHDRAGYYICWGCLMWVPSIYASPALYLAGHPADLAPLHAALLLVGGLACIWINYDADRQRQTFRATGGRARVWGAPPRKLVATYTTASGARKQSLLLASGWWGVARHFHYLPEILAALAWSAPAAASAPLPYFYVAFLTALLVDRAFRDDARCGAKYGAVWDEYRALVPYKIVPGVF